MGKILDEDLIYEILSVVEEIPARTGKMGQFYLWFYTHTLVEP